MYDDQRQSTADSGCPEGFEQALNLLPIFAYVADLSDRRIVCAGERVVELLGYNCEAVVQRGLAFFDNNTHPSDIGRHRSWNYEALAEGEAIERELRMQHKNGHWCWVRRREVVIARNADQSPSRILGIAEDITKRKQSERHLVRHHEHLLQLLAYDIHDGLVQDIVGAQMALESVIETVGTTEVECGQELILLRGLLRKAIGEGRRMITTLRPMIIDEMGVVEAINYLVAEEQATQRLRVTFTHDVRFHRLAPMLEGIIFRIAQESLNNVRRHANTDHAEIRLTQTDGMLMIEIEDRGVGFDLTKIEDHHFGLEGIRERARLFGGKAVIQSAVGKGTTVTVKLPTELSPEWQDNPTISGAT